MIDGKLFLQNRNEREVEFNEIMSQLQSSSMVEVLNILEQEIKKLKLNLNFEPTTQTLSLLLPFFEPIQQNIMEFLIGDENSWEENLWSSAFFIIPKLNHDNFSFFVGIFP